MEAIMRDPKLATAFYCLGASTFAPRLTQMPNGN